MKIGRSSGLPKPTAFDYVVMIGGPIVCLLAIWFGMSRIMGPQPVKDPVAKLHDGVIAKGSTEKQTLSELGPPKAVTEDDTGGFVYRYQRSVYRGDARELAEEDALVQFSVSNVVTGITYDVHTVKAEGPAKQ